MKTVFLPTDKNEQLVLKAYVLNQTNIRDEACMISISKHSASLERDTEKEYNVQNSSSRLGEKACFLPYCFSRQFAMLFILFKQIHFNNWIQCTVDNR